MIYALSKGHSGLINTGTKGEGFDSIDIRRRTQAGAMPDNAADKTRASRGRMLGERRGKDHAFFASSFGRATLNQFKK